MLGFIQFVVLLAGVFVSFSPSYIDEAIERWGKTGEPSEYLAHWPTDFTADVKPFPCHSHNDYWRRVPLYSALQAGCIGVEADVWLFDNDLYVGHSKSALTLNRTLTTLYIDPLADILDKQNHITHSQKPTWRNRTPKKGVFDTDRAQTVILLVDFKTKGADIWRYLDSQLAPLRDRGYLTHFDGSAVIERPVTVVATGNAPFDLVLANTTYRDIFFDAPLDALVDQSKLENRDTVEPSLAHVDSFPQPSPYNRTNSFYASVSFGRLIGFPWRLHLSHEQKRLIRTQIRSAHSRGLKVRYWDVLSWPPMLRKHLWTELIREGVDVLNVDDLRGASKEWSSGSLI